MPAPKTDEPKILLPFTVLDFLGRQAFVAALGLGAFGVMTLLG